MKRKDNKIEDCYIRLRDPDDIIFTELKSGEVLVNLKGYAIVPKEQYLKELMVNLKENRYGDSEKD